MIKDCIWRSNLGTRCRALDEAVCEARKCSFYENEKEFCKRMQKYEMLIARKNTEKRCS
ncbi:MAG: hypothetical protein IKU87_02490 [Clostridia bacterium]|nr:hypothetical protein [Clostridia bacterium]